MSGARASEATVDLGAIRHNYAELARLAAGRSVIAVVKADAYGHGAVPVARALAGAGCRQLGVLSVAEAAELREAGVALSILVMSGVHDAQEAATAARLGLTPVVHHPGHLELLAAAGREAGAPLRVHVEVDTGMRRMGVPPGEAAALLACAAAEPALELEGVFTHFARADEPDLTPSLDQLSLFRRVLGDARARGARPEQVHVANSAALLAGKELAEALPEANAVRPGLALYGVLPAPHLAPHLAPHRQADLRAAMTLRARVSHVRALRPGESVGYAALFRAARRTRIATVPLGYADGIPVAASNRGRVLLHGKRLPIAGRVSMDYVSVDCGDEPVRLGDEVVFFGQPRAAGAPRLPVEEAAAAAGTIPYELLVRVGARVPRVVVD